MKENNDVVSIVFGDSIVYGLHDKELGGWVNRVRMFLENNLNNNFVINLGIPGQNSSDILERFENEIKMRYNDSDNFNIIFSLGIKDSLLLSKDEKHIVKFERNILEIIDKTKKYTKNIYFIGLIKTDNKKRREYKQKNIIQIDKSLEKICKKNNVEYIKLRNLIDKEHLQDGLHPNNLGHKKISEIILQKIFKQ